MIIYVYIDRYRYYAYVYMCVCNQQTWKLTPEESDA